MKTSLSGQLGQPSLSFSPIRNVICLNMVYAFAVKGLFGEHEGRRREGRLPTLPQRRAEPARRISYIRAIFRLLRRRLRLCRICPKLATFLTICRQTEKERDSVTVQLTDQKGNQRTELPQRQIQHSYTRCCRC